jgi:protein-tyrosine-phosphatase
LDKLPNCDIKDVPDPYFGDFEGYIEVFGLISEACEIIVEDLKNFERPL